MAHASRQLLFLLTLICAGAAQAQTGQFKLFRDSNFGFSFEMPTTWEFVVNANRDYVFSGPAGTPARDATIVVQIITKKGNRGATDRSVLNSFWQTLSGVPGARLEGEGMVPVGPGTSPYFIARYLAMAGVGKRQEFGHIQVIVAHGGHFFPLSFSGPNAVYEEYLKVFQHMVATFAFK